jgi:hypothetical protein
MKTAVSLEDDVIQIVRDYAVARNLDLDTALSVLVRKGIESPLSVRLANRLHVADLPADSPVVTSERVKEVMDEEGF